jgi:putative DNA primase/helicase
VTDTTSQALAIAHDLVEAGIPVFAAPPAPGTKIGFALPSRWQQTKPDHALVDAWQPGWALCMVCGHLLDGIDVDTYADGDLAALQGALGGVLPDIYGVAATASGGTHLLVASLGVASKNGLFPGIDIKAGEPGGHGRGFLFIAPTVKAHKITGLPGQYGWLPGGVNLVRLREGGDRSGESLARLVHAVRGSSPSPKATQENGHAGGPEKNENGLSPSSPSQVRKRLTVAEFMALPMPKISPWKDVPATLAAEGRNNGTMRLACSLRAATSLTLEQAVAEMYATVWPLIDSRHPTPFPEREFEEVIRAIWRQYPGGGDKIAESVAALGLGGPPGTPVANGLPPATGTSGPREGATGSPPLPHSSLDLTDAFLVHWVAWTLNDGGMNGPYRWAPGLGWMRWSGTAGRKNHWSAADVADVWEEVRQYFIWLLKTVAAQGADQALLARLTALLTKARIGAITDLSRGHELVRCDAADFDAYPDLLNTPAGIVDLRTGETRPHDPRLMLTKVTSGNYVPGFTHPDWEQALTALDPPEREWLQGRTGQAATGHPPTDGIMPVLVGSGENAKSCLTTDGPVIALGDYADMASSKLIASQRANSTEHSTEMADLRGQRLLIGEELHEGHSINVTALKRIMDVGLIKARYVHKDNITFPATHTLMVTTNYRPVIAETDHGTWRRLALLTFPYTYKKEGEPLLGSRDRRGDPGLKHRIRHNESGQHDAICTWVVQGAMRWYGRGSDAPVTARIAQDTRTWRASADHVLGFWDEFLEGDPGAPGGHPPCITVTHLLAVFNAWLGKNGHVAWTKQTFAERFGEHETTRGNGVSRQKTKRLGNLSRYSGSEIYVAADPPSTECWVWAGVRFKFTENPVTCEGDEGDKARTNVPSGPFTGTFVKPLSPSSRDVQPPETPESNYPQAETSPALDSPAGRLANPAAGPTTGTLVFDLETASADTLFTTTDSDNFVRLPGSLAPGGEPEITSAQELLRKLECAQTITGHNILGFDLLALAHHHGADFTALAAKAVDTELIARQVWPPRSRDTGHSADSYGLDAVAERLSLPGKTDDLKRLARQHGGYDKIPVTDEEYRSYLEGDLRATAAVAAAIGGYRFSDPYVAREHALAAVAGRMTLNGFRVDEKLLDRRYQEGEDRKRGALQLLHDAWDLPLGKNVLRGRGANKTEQFEAFTSPLSSGEGREWLAGMWERYGIPDPPVTVKTGKLAIGNDDLAAIAKRPECPASLKAALSLMAIVTGTRTVYQTARDCLCPDGRVHPGNSFRQASGRWSTTNPGLTVFGKHEGRHVERDIFLPDEGHVLVSFDLSQVDMRAMAGHSQDPAYMALFAPGKDAHAEIAAQVGVARQDAKAIGHGYNYGLGEKRMIANGLDPVKVRAFIEGMEARFGRLIQWRETIRAQGKAGEILDNGFGRRMLCDPARAYTVAPALLGQGAARDIMGESLLRIPFEYRQYMRVMVHDEVVCSLPKADALEIAREIKKAMTWVWRDVPILVDLSVGMSWGEASAKLFFREIHVREFSASLSGCSVIGVANIPR